MIERRLFVRSSCDTKRNEGYGPLIRTPETLLTSVICVSDRSVTKEVATVHSHLDALCIV